MNELEASEPSAVPPEPPRFDLDALTSSTENLTTGCAHCSQTFTGSAEGGRAWFVEHRAKAHPELPQAPERSRRRGL